MYGLTNVNVKIRCEINVPKMDKNTQNRFRPLLSITYPRPGAQTADIM